MNSETFANLILFVAGVLLQFCLVKIPKLKNWYEKQTNKGMIAFCLDILVGFAYFLLGCVPEVAQALKLQLACSVDGVSILLNAIWIIVISQQGAYLVMPKGK